MKFFVVFILFISTLFAEHKIPLQECLHAKYGHTVGPTMHSKTILAKRLLNKVRKSLPFSDEKALIMIQEKYPDLAIISNALIIRNCSAIYQGSSKDKNYFFHTDTLNKIKEGK